MALQGVYKISDILIARFNSGDSLVDGIIEVAKKYDIRAGVILSIIGTTRELVLRNPKPYTTLPITDESETSKQTDTVFVDRPLEIITAEGNISQKDGEIHVHVHICCSQDGGRLWGGHLFRATLWTHAEVVLAKLDGPPLERHFDTATGLPQFHVID